MLSSRSRPPHSELVLHPLPHNFGAELTGLDLAHPVDSAALREILHALVDHQFLIIRGQDLTPNQQIAFSQRIGRSHIHVHRHLDHSEITILGNPRDDSTACWHTDGLAQTTAPLISLLHARELPATGGDTLFVDAYEAYENLPDEMKRIVETSSMIHQGHARPMVRVHAVTGRKALHCGLQIYVGEIVGMRSRAKEELIRELIAQVEGCVHRYRHKWQLGDVLVWDNTAVLHKGTPIEVGTARVMHRTLTMWETGYQPGGVDRVRE